jgi:hypothetical protein
MDHRDPCAIQKRTLALLNGTLDAFLARQRFGDYAAKVEGSLTVRQPTQGTNFIGSPK